jgi:hypothetical protein
VNLKSLFKRIGKIVLLPLLALDCLGNLAIGGSIHATLSAEAWHHRFHPYWGWTQGLIDAIFSPLMDSHCERCARREANYGGVWAAWLHDFRAA